jgi:glycerophosphoryl diester phosphodiesterase
MFDAGRGAKLRTIILFPFARPMYSNRPLPIAISHRGLRATATENSISAFDAAIEAGAEAIELDVHASGDGVIYVHHDPVFTIDGTTIAFAAADSSVISKAKLADDQPIPTLDQTLEAIGMRARVFIEIKARGIESDVTRCLRRHFDGYDNYAVHAFDHRVVKRMLELLPTVRTGILQVAYPIDSCSAMRAAGATDLWQHVDFIDARLVSDVRSCGGRMIAWTANSRTQWESLSALGVDGICTDHIDAYVDWRNEKRGVS